MIAIKDLSKSFGPIRAVDRVSFSVRRGEVLGFLGPNGAGKSTTMRMITGFLAPDAGTAVVCGFDVVRHPIEVKKRIGYMPEGAPSYYDMTTQSYLDFIADIHGLAGGRRTRLMDAAIGNAHIEKVLDRPIEVLSKGYRRRVALAQAIVHDPEVLILDEPTEGLDPNQKFDVRALINQMANDKAIIISTHILEEVEAVCTRAMVIAEGRLVADSTPAELQARAPYHNAVLLRFGDAVAEAALAALKDLPGLADIVVVDRRGGWTRLRARPRGGASIVADLSSRLKDRGLSPQEIQVERGNMDDVFRQLTMRASMPSSGAAADSVSGARG